MFFGLTLGGMSGLLSLPSEEACRCFFADEVGSPANAVVPVNWRLNDSDAFPLERLAKGLSNSSVFDHSWVVYRGGVSGIGSRPRQVIGPARGRMKLP